MASVTGSTAALQGTGNANSTAYVSYALDENNNPIESSGVFIFNGVSYATGYSIASALLTTCQLLGK